MAISVQNVTTHGLQDLSGSSASSFTVTKRLVSDDALDMTDATDLAAIKAAAFGDPLDALVTLTDSNPVGRHRLRQTNVVPVAGSGAKVFDCVGKFDSLYTWVKWNDGASDQAQLALPVEIELDSTPRSVVMYRTGSFTTSPSANLTTTSDIGGTKVDYASKPVPAQIPQMRTKVSLIFDCGRSGSTLVSAYDRIASITGTWNSATFLHWSANTVFCESANISHVRDEIYRTTYIFVWDQWYSCDQIPKTDVWGKYSVDANGSASTVTWKSQYRSTYDHNNIFSDQPVPNLAKWWARKGTWEGWDGT